MTAYQRSKLLDELDAPTLLEVLSHLQAPCSPAPADVEQALQNARRWALAEVLIED